MQGADRHKERLSRGSQLGSGVRGLSFDYPEQVSSALPTVTEYPYCIQALGKDVYVVNVGLRAAYNGLDLFTYKCDNHYVDYLAGHVFMNAIRIGGGSEGGRVADAVQIR